MGGLKNVVNGEILAPGQNLRLYGNAQKYSPLAGNMVRF